MEENRNKLGLEDNAYAKFIITYGRSVTSIKEGLQADRQVTVQKRPYMTPYRSPATQVPESTAQDYRMRV